VTVNWLFFISYVRAKLALEPTVVGEDTVSGINVCVCVCVVCVCVCVVCVCVVKS